jgi:ribosome-associated protein
VSKVTSYTDYVLIVTATSDRHARALADHLVEQVREKRIRPLGVEGMESAQWILVDYGDVIVHILQASARDYYSLDHLWSGAEELPIDDSTGN